MNPRVFYGHTQGCLCVLPSLSLGNRRYLVKGVHSSALLLCGSVRQKPWSCSVPSVNEPELGQCPIKPIKGICFILPLAFESLRQHCANHPSFETDLLGFNMFLAWPPLQIHPLIALFLQPFNKFRFSLCLIQLLPGESSFSTLT